MFDHDIREQGHTLRIAKKGMYERKTSYASLVWAPHENPGKWIDPTMVFPDGSPDAQHLMDALWDGGVRPRGYRPPQSLPQADHIADLRKIVFKQMGIDE
jgi:hypothetical protein